MSVTSTPIFAQALAYGVAQVSTANTGRDGSGTVPTVITAGANGTIIDHIDIHAAGTTTAGMVRLYITLDSGPTTRLWKEQVVTAITPSASLAAFDASIDCSQRGTALFLPSGYSLRASTHNAETFNVHAYGSNL